MYQKVKTETIEDYLCNRMFKINVKRLLSKPLQLYIVAKYHFTNGENFIYIDFNQRTKQYYVLGTRDFSQKYIDLNNDGYVFIKTYDFIEARKKYYELIKEYIEFLYVMY